MSKEKPETETTAASKALPSSSGSTYYRIQEKIQGHWHNSRFEEFQIIERAVEKMKQEAAEWLGMDGIESFRVVRVEQTITPTSFSVSNARAQPRCQNKKP